LASPCKSLPPPLKQLIHGAFLALHKNHVRKGTGKAFFNGIRKQSTEQQLRLGTKRTVSQALWQTLELEVVKLAVGSSIRLWKTSAAQACIYRNPLYSVVT
jgi:hypothetical protein